MNAKQWLLRYGIVSVGLAICCAGLTIFIDPCFHYHKPFTDTFFYSLDNERYINDGITRNFDYDAVITGTSMTENFRTSEFDAIFDCHSIKVPFSGGRYFEINNNQKVAFKNHTVTYMVRSLDYSSLEADKNTVRSDTVYPEYLYNDFLFDDIKYVLNSTTFMQSLRTMVSRKHGITAFDDYVYWSNQYIFGKESVLAAAKRSSFDTPEKTQPLTAEDAERIRGNVQQNVVDLALQHPETQFYYFFPPYSIAWWKRLHEDNELEKQLVAEQLAIEMIISCENIHLFSFNTKFDWITDLNNYKDTLHYGEWINSDMLRLMKNDEYRITKDNAAAYLQAEREFYTTYDYNSIFAE